MDHDSNKRNLLYFERGTMRRLYEQMEEWEATHNRRLLSVSIQPDGDMFCCIALTNPSEVVLVHRNGDYLVTNYEDEDAPALNVLDLS